MSLKYVWRERCVTSRGTLLNGCYEVGTTCKLIYVYTIMGGTQTWSTLVKIMAFRLFGTTPLNQPIMNLKKSMDPIQSSKYYILSFNDIHFCNICNKLTSILFSCKCVNSSFKVLALGWFSCETHCAWNAGICFVLFCRHRHKTAIHKIASGIESHFASLVLRCNLVLFICYHTALSKSTRVVCRRSVSQRKWYWLHIYLDISRPDSTWTNFA